MDFDVKGMSIQDIRGLNTRSLTTSEMRAGLTRMNSAANKRIARMQKDPIGRNAPDIARLKGEKFTSKGLKTRAEVKAAYDKVRNFLDPSKESHTLGGWKDQVQRMEEKHGLTEDQVTDPEFWKNFRQFLKDNKNWDSSRALELVGEAYDAGEDVDDFTDAMYNLEQSAEFEGEDTDQTLLDLIEAGIPLDQLVELTKNPEFVEDLASGRLYEIMNDRRVMEDLLDGIYEKDRYEDVAGEFDDYIE